MKYFIPILLIILIFSSCFSYEKQLEKYDYKSTEASEYLKIVGDHNFSEKERKLLVAVEKENGLNSLAYSRTKFTFFLYTKTYGVSYFDDSLDSKRRKEFDKNLADWVLGKYKK